MSAKGNSTPEHSEDDAASDGMRMVNEIALGGPEGARQLLPVVYEELRAMAARHMRDECGTVTLNATALAHEAFLKLVDQSRVNWRGRAHFLGVASEAMRRILIDAARRRQRAKRGGGWQRTTLSGVAAAEIISQADLFDLNQAIAKLRELDPDQARIVEMKLIEMTDVEVAEAAQVSRRTVQLEWSHAKAWLKSELSRGGIGEG